MSFWEKYSPDHTTFHPAQGNEGEVDEWFYWVINAPTFSDEKKLAKFLQDQQAASNVYEIATQELVLTFGGTNFPHPDSPTHDPDSPDFKPALLGAASPKEIQDYLDTLPSGVVLAMWEKLQEVAPNWGPNFQR